MTADILDRNPPAAEEVGSVYTDDIMPCLADWMARDERCALVTLVGVDGNAPRAIGAQMAVSETGHWTGYISGGCLEQAIVLEAIEAIRARKPRLLRYGKGSPYFDIRLPCGSGLDVFIQPLPPSTPVADMNARLKSREAFALTIDLGTGESRTEPLAASPQAMPRSHRSGDTFTRVYAPAVRCMILGTSPIAAALSDLAFASGFDTVFYTSDPERQSRGALGIDLLQLAPPVALKTDPWTAAILAFHDHDLELPLFTELLKSPCFFIGAIGSRNAHAARLLALAALGFEQAQIERIKSPAGLVAGLKTAPFVALSILAQVVAAARDNGLAV